MIISASGTTTTDGTEQTLATVTDVGWVYLVTDVSNLANGDTIEIRVKTRAKAGGTTRLWKLSTLVNAQSELIYLTEPALNVESCTLTLKRTAGSDHAYDWTAVTQQDGGSSTVTDISSAALAKFFTVNTGQTYSTSVAGSVVKEIADNAAGSGTAGDPWSTVLPGSYASGTAGSIVGTFLLRQGNVVFRRGVAYPNFTFSMKGSDGAPKSGLTVTAERSLDGAAFATASNAVSELSDGWYALSMSAADMNGAVIGWRMSASGAVDRNFTLLTQLPSP